MSHKTKTQATAAGRAAMKLLPSRAGWTLEVWENLGWHFCLQHGPISIHESFGGNYGCLIARSIDETRSGSGEWSNNNPSKGTPWDAAMAEMKCAEQAIQENVARLTALSEYMAIVRESATKAKQTRKANL